MQVYVGIFLTKKPTIILVVTVTGGVDARYGEKTREAVYDQLQHVKSFSNIEGQSWWIMIFHPTSNFRKRSSSEKGWHRNYTSNYLFASRWCKSPKICFKGCWILNLLWVVAFLETIYGKETFQGTNISHLWKAGTSSSILLFFRAYVWIC